MTQRFLLVAAMVIGTVVPWLFFGRFVTTYGVDVPTFVRQLFATDPAAGFVIDLQLSILIFLVASYVDARAERVRHWWLVLPAASCVGLSLAMPLYLWLRSGAGVSPAPRRG